MDQRNSMLSTNEELHSRVEALQGNLEDLKKEISRVTEENATNQALLMEKERDRQLLAQNKASTSKHLGKLQADMQEWRKQTDENLKIKEKQIEDLQAQATALQKEKDRLKSENQMLRRVDKDRRNVDPDDYRRL
jgi:regulator of replication initiation timing